MLRFYRFFILALMMCQSILAKDYSHENQGAISKQIERILAQHKLSKLPWDIKSVELERQKSLFNNKIPFLRALDLALFSFLNDDSDMESPLALIKESNKVEAKIKLRALLNKKNSSLVLISIKDSQGDGEYLGPQRGERIAEFWIILLAMPEFSDHLFWALVDRSGRLPTINYGFN